MLHCKEVWRCIVDQHKAFWFSLKFKTSQHELKQKKNFNHLHQNRLETKLDEESKKKLAHLLVVIKS